MRIASLLLASSLLLACSEEDKLPIASGDYWELTLRVESANPCPAVELPTELGVKVREQDGKLVLLPGFTDMEIDGVVINERADHAVFVAHDVWTTDDGVQVYPTLTFEVTVYPDGGVSGIAKSEFNFDTETAGTTCRQTFDVTGYVIRDDGDCKPGQIGPLCG